MIQSHFVFKSEQIPLLPEVAGVRLIGKDYVVELEAGKEKRSHLLPLNRQLLAVGMSCLNLVCIYHFQPPFSLLSLKKL